MVGMSKQAKETTMRTSHPPGHIDRSCLKSPLITALGAGAAGLNPRATVAGHVRLHC